MGALSVTMGSFCNAIPHCKKVDREKINIYLLGLESAGKTTVLYRLVFSDVGETIVKAEPTISFNKETI